MRLTLRTLLAYLDDVLDPADKEELGKKIESSDFAEDLVHRTRDTVRRLRLSAPQVIGTGMGLDPNSVSEYLDNVMPPDAVGDFERICLESDVHLAEAAACHHVLTMVLGQPADVDPLARQRMYTIANEAGERRRLRVEPAHKMMSAASPAAPAAAPLAAPVATQQPRTIEIPEYLRTGRWWRSWGAVAGLAALVLVGITILLASGLGGWFHRNDSLAELTPNTAAPATDTGPPVTSSTVDQATTNPQKDSGNGAVTTASATPPLGPPPQPLNPAMPPSAPASATPPASTANSPYEPTNGANSIATTPPPKSTVAVVPQTNEASPANAIAQNPVPPANPALPPAPAGVVSSAAPIPGNATASIPEKGAVNLPPPIPPQLSQGAAIVPPEAGAAPPSPPSADLAGAAPPVPATLDANAIPGVKSPIPPGPPELGTYMGGKTVLLRFDGKTGTWFRIEPRSAVIANERLLALPEFRPKIALISGLHLDLSGGTQVVMGNGGGLKPEDPAPKADAAAVPAVPLAVDIPTIELVYGRIVLINPTNGENRVRLKLGTEVGEAQLEKKATLAVEVERKHVPGQDPQQTPAPIECRLFAPDGGVVWKDSAGTKTAEKPSRWTVTAKGATDPVANTTPPEWVDHEPIVQLSDQRYGAPVVESALVSNIPADTQLLELFQGSKERYVKSLVARSSIHVGLFVPFIDALRDSEQKSNWKTHIDTLRAAMALSPESAAKVLVTLEEQRGKPAAKDLYEMLCGYSPDQVGHTPEQMKNGAVARLIDFLENDSLDYRVLAWHDLKEITGKQLMPNPAAGVTERTRNVKAWRARLDEPGGLKLVAPMP